MPRKMALDFDEVVVQSHRIIAQAFSENFGLHLPAHVYRYSDWENPPVSEEEFLKVIFETTPSALWIERAEPLPGALSGVQQLLEWGIEIDILTSRGKYPGELEAVSAVLGRFGWDFPVIGTAYQPKVEFLGDHSLIMDDQFPELLAMEETGIHRLHFRRPHNLASWEQSGRGIVPVRDWPHATEIIRDLLPL